MDSVIFDKVHVKTRKFSCKYFRISRKAFKSKMIANERCYSAGFHVD